MKYDYFDDQWPWFHLDGFLPHVGQGQHKLSLLFCHQGHQEQQLLEVQLQQQLSSLQPKKYCFALDPNIG